MDMMKVEWNTVEDGVMYYNSVLLPEDEAWDFMYEVDGGIESMSAWEVEEFQPQRFIVEEELA